MEIDISDMPWVGGREKYDKLFDSILEQSEQLAWPEGMGDSGVPEMMLSPLVEMSGKALEFLNGKKWGYHVITAIFMKQEMGFTELSKIIKGVSNRALSTRLKECTEMGLIVRKVDPGPPMRTSYSLTEHGRIVATLIAPLVYYMKREMGLLHPIQFITNEFKIGTGVS